MGQEALSGPVAVDKKMLEAIARNSVKEKEEQKDKSDSSGFVARQSSKR